MFSLTNKIIWAAVGLAVLVGVGVFYLESGTPPREPEPALKVKELAVPRPEFELVGKSVQGREIRAYTYGSGPIHLLLVGGMHGGYEWNSVVLSFELMDYLKAYPAVIPTSTTIVIIPNLNPDGVYKIVGKEGRFAVTDVPTIDSSTGRFNAHDVDLNRNFDCKWQPKGTWRTKTVSAGTAAFSEPESLALKKYVEHFKPRAVVFYHSQANAVYASECSEGILPETLDIMNVYAKAANYPAVKSFDAYEVHGDAEGWLASIHIPAITVEMSTHDTIEWDKNLAGVKALLAQYAHAN